MSNTTASLSHKIDSASELQSVVRTMKAMAASNIGQYESAVRSLDAYYLTVQLALAACLREREIFSDRSVQPDGDRPQGIGAVVFGSDQGLVGPFNDAMVEFVVKTLALLPGQKMVWAVGERIRSRLVETDLNLGTIFVLPNSIDAITPLVGQILGEVETRREKKKLGRFIFFIINQNQEQVMSQPANVYCR